MNKINFENGEKISDAIVTIEGTDYIVTPAQYSGRTPVSASNLNLLQKNVENQFNSIETGISAIQSEIASLIETGTNSNGSYLKYANGKLICFNNFTFSQAINSTSGSIYVGDYTTAKAFPYEFIKKPTLTMVTDGDYYACWLGGVSWNKTSITKITLNRATSLASNTIGVSYVAIGRWK